MANGKIRFGKQSGGQLAAVVRIMVLRMGWYAGCE